MAAMAIHDSKEFVNKVRLTVLQYKLSIQTLLTFVPKSDKKDRSQQDITKLCRVLSNKYGLKPENFNNDWGRLPLTSDKTEGADVFRLRLRRNEVVHSPKEGIEDDKFKEIWEELVDVYCRRLGFTSFKTIEALSGDNSISNDVKADYKRILEQWSSELKKHENDEKAAEGMRLKATGENITMGDMLSPELTVINAGEEATRKAVDAIPSQPKGNVDIEIHATKDATFGSILSSKTTITNNK